MAGLSLCSSVGAQTNDIAYSACPLIAAYYPPPTFTRTSEPFKKLSADFTKTFNQLIEKGGSDDYGQITPNTTSFSVVMFTGAEAMKEDPAFFEYHYTSPHDHRDTGINLTSDTKLPVGDLTMVFTVYAWLVKMGETWDTPITRYLPELKMASKSGGVAWEEATIGSLAGHLSGLIRQTEACAIGAECEWDAFAELLAVDPFVFHPDTTPMVSYTAFQLLAFAMTRHSGVDEYSTVLQEAVLDPLNMTSSGHLGPDVRDVFAYKDLNTTQQGEPAAISLISTIADLARAGNAMLSSRLLPPAVTRRWLHHSVDTSNLRNGVGRPWEIYRAGGSAISPIVDVWTKSGSLGSHYASYFGLVPDFDVGFAILAHDGGGGARDGNRSLDLNVYADVVSEALGHLQSMAAAETAARYAGTYQGGNGSVAALEVTKDGPGLEVQGLRVNGVDVRAETAQQMGLGSVADLDVRLYPTNVREGARKHHFVAVFQDRSAPVDMGTPTCITWQEVGSLAGVSYRFAFELDDDGTATSFQFLSSNRGDGIPNLVKVG
ncbi:beta-lactamase family protein [Apiospora sp. TS-2023a]